MAPIHSIQPTFAGGEFAPSLQSRVDLQKYATGLKKAKNMFVHPHGGASNRPGTKLVCETKDSTKKARIVEFEFSATQAYGIEFGDLYVRFHTDGGTVTQASQAITAVTKANPAVVTYTGSDTYANGDRVKIASVAGMTELNNREFVVAGVNTAANTFQLSGVDSTSYTTYTSGGTVSEIYEVVTPYLEADLFDLQFTQSADVLYITHPDYQQRTLTRLSDSPPSWQLALFAFTDGPFMSANITTTHTLSISAVATGAGRTLTSSVAMFEAEHVGALFQIRHDMAGEAVSASFGATGTSGSINFGGTWRLITHGTWTGTLRVEKSTDGGGSWSLLRLFTASGDFNANTSGTDDGPYLIRLNMSAYTSGTCNADLSTDPYEHRGVVKVTAVAAAYPALTATVEVLTRCGLAATTTWDWSEGSWSDRNGWPQAIVFFQDRLCFAATGEEPQTCWMSETGKYTSFARSQPLVDSDGISVALPSRRLNGIRNLCGLGDIVALTSATDWTIGPAAGGAITPTNIDQRLHGYRGSSGVEPAIVGNQILYVSPMGSGVRNMGYDERVKGFTGDSVTTYANHLFTGYSVIEMAYQQEPDSLVWAVRDDGKLLSLTYVPEQEVIAWTWHETDGLVESICCIPADGFNELWMIVKRGTKRFVERMVQRMESDETRDQFFVDSGLTYDSPKTITGSTAASPVVITSTAHGFSNGDLVDISDIVWVDDSYGEQPDQLNGVRYKVAGVTANTFQLTDEEAGTNVDGSAFLAYSSAGKARKCVSSVSGLWHLNGETVSILANGNVYPQAVVANGSITLDPVASTIHAGLPYESDLQTLAIELRMEDGTVQDRKVQIPSVTLQFLNSRGGYLGPDEDTLDEVIQRTNEPLNAPIALFTGGYDQAIAGGYQTGGSVYFRQSDPLPVTILAVIPKVEPGG